MDIKENFFYFNISATVSFIYFDNNKKDLIVPVNVVLELKENNAFNLANIEVAKQRAVSQVVEILGNEKAEEYTKDADIVLPALTSISFLGSCTHEEFVANDSSLNQE